MLNIHKAEETKKKIEETIHFIRSQSSSPIQPSVGITLGSGLSAFGDLVNKQKVFSFQEIPHFAPATIEGHPGQLILGNIGNQQVAVLQGRVHFYEGHSPWSVVYPTQILKALGVHTLVLTNAAGGLNPQMNPGDFMILTDHINLMGYNPLVGPNLSFYGPRFPDMTEVYSLRLRKILVQQLKKKNISFHEGVYVGLSGPSYETPAEIRFLQKIGGDAVGMSTVPEAIVAHHMGLEIAGISCITNLGSGLSKHRLSHEEVKTMGEKVEKTFSRLLCDFLESL